jgi:predicted permease
MDRLLYILAISFGSIAAGYAVKQVARNKKHRFETVLPAISRRLKLLAFFILNPIAFISTFWGASMPDIRVLTLPLLGLASIFIGMAAAFAAIRVLKIEAFRAGSVFTCGTVANVLTIGGLVAYTFFREPGYFLVQLTNLTMYPAYFLLVYPISANVGLGRKPVFKVSVAGFKENPYLLLPLTATVIGVIIRLVGPPRPPLFADTVGFIVPSSAAVLGLSIGVTLHFSRVRSYLREVAAILIIRHVVLPAIMISLAILLRFADIADGLPLKITIILSTMPVAFSALVPPAIYGFDLDLANSAWMVSTALLIIIVPVLYAVFTFLL